MAPAELRLDLITAEEDADAARLDELTVRLMRDLRDLGSAAAERPAGTTIPVGAKDDPGPKA
jgi:hypothetical protein